METEKISKEIKAAILAVQAKIKPIVKGDLNKQLGYRYISTFDVVKEVNKLMSDAGLSVTFAFSGLKVENGVLIQRYEAVLFTAEDGSEYHYAPQIAMMKHNPAQGLIRACGAMQSYIRKYFYIQLFNIPVAEEDSDSDHYNPQPKQVVKQVIAKPALPKSKGTLQKIEYISKFVSDRLPSRTTATQKAFGNKIKAIGGSYKFGSFKDEHLTTIVEWLDQLPKPAPVKVEEVKPEPVQEPEVDNTFDSEEDEDDGISGN